MSEIIDLPRGMYIEIEITRDDFCEDPRESMDMASIHVFRDRASFWSFMKQNSWDEADYAIALNGGVLSSDGRLYMGLERYSHSGDTYALCRAGNFPDRRWDVSPLVGFISPHPDVDSDVISTYESDRPGFIKRLNQDITTFNHWVAGEVYEYEVFLYDASGDQIGESDACGGFLGEEDYCLQAAKEQAFSMAVDVLSKDEIRQYLEDTCEGGLAEYVRDLATRVLSAEEREGKTSSEVAHRLYYYITKTYLANASAHVHICRVKGDMDEYPDHPMDDWKYEVGNGDTILGYWEWVSHMIESRKGDNDGNTKGES